MGYQNGLTIRRLYHERKAGTGGSHTVGLLRGCLQRVLGLRFKKDAHAVHLMHLGERLDPQKRRNGEAKLFGNASVLSAGEGNTAEGTRGKSAAHPGNTRKLKGNHG